MGVSESINELIDRLSVKKIMPLAIFLQCYMSEQIEEEKSARVLNDKLEMIGEDKSGLYLFDRDIRTTRQKGRRK